MISKPTIGSSFFFWEIINQHVTGNHLLSLSMIFSEMPFPWWLIYLLVTCISSLEKSIFKSFVHFPWVLLRYNRYVTLCKFKAYNMLFWYTYILKNDYHYSIRVGPFFIRLFFCYWIIGIPFILWRVAPSELCNLWIFFSHSASCLFSLLTAHFSETS